MENINTNAENIISTIQNISRVFELVYENSGKLSNVNPKNVLPRQNLLKKIPYVYLLYAIPNVFIKLAT